MGIHRYSVVVWRGLKSSPIAEWLECVVDELNSVACLARAIRVSVESDKRPRGVLIKTLESPYVSPGIVPILPYSSKNGGTVVSGGPGIKIWVKLLAVLDAENSLVQGCNDRHNVRLTSIGGGNRLDDFVSPIDISLVRLPSGE